MENTCPVSHVFTFDCQTPDQRRGGKGGAVAFTSLKSYQSDFIKDFGNTRQPGFQTLEQPSPTSMEPPPGCEIWRHPVARTASVGVIKAPPSQFTSDLLSLFRLCHMTAVHLLIPGSAPFLCALINRTKVCTCDRVGAR